MALEGTEKQRIKLNIVERRDLVEGFSSNYIVRLVVKKCRNASELLLFSKRKMLKPNYNHLFQSRVCGGGGGSRKARKLEKGSN